MKSEKKQSRHVDPNTSKEEKQFTFVLYIAGMVIGTLIGKILFG